MRTKKLSYGFILILTVLLLVSAILCATTINAGAINNTIGVDDTYISFSEDNNEPPVPTPYSGTDTAGQNGRYVRIGGTPLGIVIKADGLIVTGLNGVETPDGLKNPAAAADFKRGDVITEIGAEKADNLFNFKKYVETNAAAGAIDFKVKRGGNILRKRMIAVKDNSGAYKLGLFLKEDVGGVGTLTFTTDNGNFAALGHHIYDPESGLSSELNGGNVYNIKVDGVQKGVSGKAGGLIASVNRLQPTIGSINSNTRIGLYGKMKTPDTAAETYRIAEFGEAKMGRAQVYTTINGSSPKFYDIDVVKVVSQSAEGEKGMVIAVKDKELLDKAGGIVQGMSGSPIVQNGLLIGAVTHVFISDPTRGYAVHSRFMYDRTALTPAA